MTTTGSNKNSPEDGYRESDRDGDAPETGDVTNPAFEVQPAPLGSIGLGSTDPDSRDFDEVQVFERVRTQWQLGEWSRLVRLVRGTMEDHPERAKLASFAAVAHAQLGDQSTARHYASLARRWGCSKDLLGRLMISGAYNSLAIAKLRLGERDQALKHFERSVSTVTPRADIRALARIRLMRETVSLGHLPAAAEFLDDEFQHDKDSGVLDSARLRIFETELKQLRHELSIAQRRGQLEVGTRDGLENGMPTDGELSTDELERHSRSQLGQDIWVLDRTGFKRNGFFVEFGATDGVALSNTWLLEKYFNWDGICAEPNPAFYRQLVENRTCTVVDACIAGSSGREVEFILAAEFGGIAEYAQEDMHVDKRSAYADRGHLMTMTTISLDDFLEMHNAPRQIDYLSIDTEGSELEILAAFPFEKWCISYLTVEHNYSGLRPQLRDLLESNGYRCVEREWDDWYEYVAS